MGIFRRVEGEQAGPGALGILVPPGKRTFVILRPRALAWDLVLVRAGGQLDFRQLAHDEASRAAAQRLFRGLREWASGGEGRLEVVVLPVGCVVQLILGGLCLLVCPRTPGQPYQPFVSSDESSASLVIGALQPLLCPPGSTEQEIYFNVRFFES